MSGPDGPGGCSLTGIWNGLYTYRDGRSNTFVATLIEAGRALSGTTHEPGARGAGAMLTASLVGARAGCAVTFTKTYDDPDRDHRSSVLYEGTLNGDATEIAGRWTIVGMWSGTFLMIRPEGQMIAVERSAFERTK